MADRASANLQSGGLSMLNEPMSARTKGIDKTRTPSGLQTDGATPTRPFKDMTLEEMEQALTRYQRKPIDNRSGHDSGAQTARALLAENQQLVQDKVQRKALQRKKSLEAVERVLAEDRNAIEADKAQEISKRVSQYELARYYKAAIVAKEDAKSKEYQGKVEMGIDSTYFPFVEGETIKRNREAQTERMRDEMRSFLKQQREERPPRSVHHDALLNDVTSEHFIKYPAMPAHAVPKGSMPLPHEGVEDGNIAASLNREVAPHVGSSYPKFLSRSREHMSRRIHDAHVRKALEAKVESTKKELQALNQQKQQEVQQWQEGLLVNDALRYDTTQSKAMERIKNQEYLKQQIQQRQARDHTDLAEWREAPAGYWGPEEKELQDSELHRVHCTDLINQMKVDQQRRLDGRNRRLLQERKLVDNSMAEMSQEREREKAKQTQHREVLTTTWKSQQKIRQAQNQIQSVI